MPTPFITLYHQYFPTIFRYVSFRIGHKSDTEDLVSEIFLKALQNFPSYREQEGATIGSWLFRIAHNAVVDYYRSHTKRSLSIEDIGELQDPRPFPGMDLDKKTIYLQIQKIVATLPKKQKEIVSLRLFAELKNKEIAEVLNLSEKTIASSYLRAMRKISSSINPLL